ncbi:hypothetical protein N7G274_007112 [Stereocaulon virgatum]|uniref:Uncharacterized protein n=1 Tax=Stereocaulon virgatum TaxID=373712 RepID=A0ABR4A3X3_9LECA
MSSNTPLPGALSIQFSETRHYHTLPRFPFIVVTLPVVSPYPSHRAITVTNSPRIILSPRSRATRQTSVMVWDPVRVARRPIPLSIEAAQYATPDPRYTTSLRYLSSLVGSLNVGPTAGQVDQSAYQCGLAIGKACVAIEECHIACSRTSTPTPPTLLAVARRAVRHARRATSAESDRATYTTTQLLFKRTIQLLRREVIRAIRHEQLEFRYPKGSTFRPTAKSLKGKKWELASFVNAACFAVTKALGCFDAPLLKLNAKPHASEETALWFWDCDGLKIVCDAERGWRVEGMGEGMLGGLARVEKSVDGGSNIEERGYERGCEDIAGEENWAKDVFESEDEMDEASSYKEEPESGQESSEGEEQDQRLVKDELQVFLAEDEGVFQDRKEGSCALRDQGAMVSQWRVRESPEMMYEEE